MPSPCLPERVLENGGMSFAVVWPVARPQGGVLIRMRRRRQELAFKQSANFSQHAVTLKDPEWAAPVARDLPKVACLVMPQWACSAELPPW